MKRIVALIIACVMVVCLTACGKRDELANDEVWNNCPINVTDLKTGLVMSGDKMSASLALTIKNTSDKDIDGACFRIYYEHKSGQIFDQQFTVHSIKAGDTCQQMIDADVFEFKQLDIYPIYATYTDGTTWGKMLATHGELDANVKPFHSDKSTVMD